MKIVITGASGFLGEALLRKLHVKNVTCIGVTRHSTPSLHTVNSYIDTPAGDVLIHLAENSNRSSANSNGLPYENEAKKILDVLLNKGYKRVIYASSAVLYSDIEVGSRLETDSISANDVYARIKMSSEQRVLSHPAGCVARLANLYGPKMAKANVISHILSQLEGHKTILLQDITPIRDFLWIEDASDALCKMAFSSENNIFNLGSGVGTSILDLAKLMRQIVNKNEIEIESIKPVEASKTSSIVLNINKAKTILNWHPKLSLQEGLIRTIHYYQNTELK